MFFRRISEAEVQSVIALEEIIEAYPDEEPPCYLLLDFVMGRALHVVFSYDREMDIGYVITAYLPSPDQWLDDFKTRKTL